MKEELIKKAAEIGVELSETQADQFMDYYEMLVETNKVMNLTAITEWEDVLLKHFVDSLASAKYIDFKKGGTLIDVGTGAGFPGIPLKIAFPEIKVTLMDSLNKRIGFLKQVIDKLGLKNIEAIHGRAEELGRSVDHREKYDYCVSRAVANLAVLSEYCTPFVKKEGLFISYKAGSVEEELEQAKNAIHMLGCELEKKEDLILPGSDIERTFLFIRRKTNISKRYPRKAGTPSKEPLGK